MAVEPESEGLRAKKPPQRGAARRAILVSEALFGAPTSHIAPGRQAAAEGFGVPRLQLSAIPDAAQHDMMRPGPINGVAIGLGPVSAQHHFVSQCARDDSREGPEDDSGEGPEDDSERPMCRVAQSDSLRVACR